MRLPGWITGYKENGAPYEPEGNPSWALYFSHLKGYMPRLILKTPWRNLRFHRILRKDDDRHPHDHPFDFTSYIIFGGYTENLYDSDGTLIDVKTYRVGSRNKKRAEDLHVIVHVLPLTVTFTVSKLKRRDWGFLTENGWVHWREYFQSFEHGAS